MCSRYEQTIISILSDGFHSLRGTDGMTYAGKDYL